MATSQKSTPKHSPTSTFSAADFRAKASQLLENEEDLPTPEELCSLRLRVSPQIKDLDFYCLKTLKGFSRTIMASLLTIVETLDELGYDLQWQVLNSKNFGVPQNRERVFIVGSLRGTRRPEVFPFGKDSKKITEQW